jgi:dihydroorotate dehydrogenase electron transfer subunit
MKYHEQAKLVHAQELDAVTFHHIYAAPAIAREARPGQFLHVRVSRATAPLLRRPISILWSDFHEHVEILFKVVRHGTALLAEKRVGETIDLVGPLGNSFPYDFTRDAVCVAGGYGIAPLCFLARANVSDHNRRILLYGARTAAAITLQPEWRAAFDEVIITTDDGSLGRKGLVTDALRDLLVARRNVAVYACGPTPMLAAVAQCVARHAEPTTPCHVSLENRMGCGVGACLGCIVPTRRGLATTCTDGPVFSAGDVLFDELLAEVAS